MIRRITLFAFSVSILGIISACAPWESAEIKPTNRADTPESLLAAEGSWQLIEAKAVGPNPVDQHKTARAQVNPADQRKKDYVAPEKVAALSAENQQDVNFRLIRMEKEVAGLRQDFDNLLPPLTKLIVADAELDRAINTVSQPAPFPGIEAMPLPVQKAPSDVMAAAPALNTIMPAAGGGASVQNIRLGDHPGKTRLVIDLSGASHFSTQIDNNEKILVVELPQAGWSLEPQKMLGHRLIAGFKAQPSQTGGTTVAFELKEPVKITASEALPASRETSNRIYLDLAPL